MARLGTLSVVVPVFNGEAYLGDALESICRQTLPADEILVVDDGSTDGSADVARSFGDRIRLLQQPNLGPDAARDRGIRTSRGALVAFLDHDDVWTDDKLRVQCRALAENPGLDLVFGHVEEFTSPELSPELAQSLCCRPGVRWSRLIGTLLAPRGVFEVVGPMACGTLVGFVDWMARAQDQGLRSLVVGELLLRRRIHGTNLTLRRRDVGAQYLSTLKAALDRRRGKADTLGAAGSADR